MPRGANDPSNVIRLDGRDSHGRAALLLAESLIHALVAKSVLTLPEAVQIIDIAIDVESDVAARVGGPPIDLDTSSLGAIASSLRADFCE